MKIGITKLIKPMLAIVAFFGTSQGAFSSSGSGTGYAWAEAQQNGGSEQAWITVVVPSWTSTVMALTFAYCDGLGEWAEAGITRGTQHYGVLSSVVYNYGEELNEANVSPGTYNLTAQADGEYAFAIATLDWY